MVGIGRGYWVQGLVASCVLLFGARAAADITISVAEPPALVADDLYLSVVIASTYELKNVHAQVESLGVDLTPPTRSGGAWTGNLALGTLSRGQKTLTVTATDALDSVSMKTVSFKHNRRPLITVTSPPPYLSAVRSPVHVVATCSDDDTETGCQMFGVRLNEQQIFTANGPVIDTWLDLPDSDGAVVTLTIGAKDSDDQYESFLRTLYVDSCPALHAVASVPGKVLDVDSSRLLYRNVANNHLVLRQLADSSETDLGAIPEPDSYGIEPKVWLTSVGATWINPASVNGCSPGRQAFEWRDGQPSEYFKGCSSALQIAGDYALWSSSDNVTLRSLATGANTVIPVPDGVSDFALSDNGEIVGFGSKIPVEGAACAVLKYRGTAFEKVVALAGCDSSRKPVSDGINVVFSNWLPGPGLYEVALIDSLANVVSLSDTRKAPYTPFSSPKDYAASGGWTAYLKKGAASGVKQVWVRAPDGTLTQLSSFGADSQIEAVSPTGEVMFQNINGRYLASPTLAPVKVSAGVGSAMVRGNSWYVAMADSAFRVDPAVDCVSQPPPGGAGGTSGQGGTTAAGGMMESGGTGGHGGASTDGGTPSELGDGGVGAVGAGGTAVPDGGTSPSTSSGGAGGDDSSDDTGGAPDGAVATGGKGSKSSSARDRGCTLAPARAAGRHGAPLLLLLAQAGLLVRRRRRLASPR